MSPVPFDRRTTIQITIEYCDETDQCVPHVTEAKCVVVDSKVAISLAFALRGLLGQDSVIEELLETVDQYITDHDSPWEWIDVYGARDDLTDVQDAIRRISDKKRAFHERHAAWRDGETPPTTAADAAEGE